MFKLLKKKTDEEYESDIRKTLREALDEDLKDCSDEEREKLLSEGEKKIENIIKDIKES